jgi:uncharacterized protein YbjT (DUF2867 family)
MNVLLFGATGMVGQGVLRECLLDPEVRLVTTVGRTACGVIDAKLCDKVHADLWNYADMEADLSGFDACFFCLGVSSVGLSESQYAHITYDITMAAAETLVRLNPRMTFLFISGVGTDSSEKGRTMWSRIKGKTENALMRLPFKASYMLRPGIIQPLHGIQSKTVLYRKIYPILGPVIPFFRKIFPGQITTTEELGRVMIAVAQHGASKQILESPDICGFFR